MKKREFVIQDLLSKIYQEQFKDGKLPNQRTMAQSYQVSRYTIQESIKTLEEIGIIETVQGSGMYVKKQFQMNPLIFNTLTRTPYERITSKFLSLEKKKSTPEEEQIFQLDNSEDIWTFERVRIVDYKIEQIERSKMPVSMFPDLTEEIIEQSIQEYVLSKKYSISHYITSYSPTLLTKKQSELLMSKRNTPAMRIENRCLLKNGKVYEYSELTAIDYTCTYITPFDKKGHQARRTNI
ncbi:GntR family transcriptional regulator [Marinilactibacillus sp. 15R]|uniref:DNA-binding transcriptional regulator, GntR family n=1 Tax=Marinilactibacillus piezotolerans TaxID=258723 RepID=A0A1I4AJP9_9LACT|nr:MULTISPECIES: GntR family transcriptional regulator [Marinilactibacillus]API87973.1 GntR family transcriptional regulator [Marinilactibacillus sp. 15R]SFK56698.1 DNA-binding transcriptional regulator, GntR family [Marinilactibacillus piezotolerans]